MTRRLPNLNAVRAFDAAARHQSFSRAAEELGVTHASVSRFVKTLEAQLGTPLFERRHRQVALTPAGARYAEIVTDALALISLDVGTPVPRSARGKVVVEADSDLALLWLMPRLTRARLAEFGLDIELRSHAEPPRTIAPDTDLALTWGAVDGPGFSRAPFLGFTVFPVCAPERAAEVRRDGIEALPLIHDRGLSGWDELFRRDGRPLPAEAGSLVFHRTYLCLDAAARGLGIAVGDDVTAGAMLADGRLVRPCGPAQPGRKTFHLSTGRNAAARPSVAMFRDWLVAQAADHARWAAEQAFDAS